MDHRGDTMRTLLLAIFAVATLAACGDATGPEPVEWINVSGEYVATSIAGDELPLRVGAFTCDGTEADLYILGVRVGLYDKDPDPAAPERAFRARTTGTADGDCWTTVYAWGTYTASSDSLVFHWPGDVAVEDGAWASGTDEWTAPTPDGVATFTRVAPVPSPPIS